MSWKFEDPPLTCRQHNHLWVGVNIFYIVLCVVLTLAMGVWPDKRFLLLIIPFALYNGFMVSDRLQYLRVNRVLYKNTKVPSFFQSLWGDRHDERN